MAPTLPTASAGAEHAACPAAPGAPRSPGGRARRKAEIPGPWSRLAFALFRPSARRRPRARCLTLLFTELADLPDARPLHDLARLLTAHDRVLLPAIRAYGGRRITSRGPSVLAAFASPTDAVLCGLAIQELLALRNGAAPAGERFSIRLAVHLGETRFRRGQLVGPPVELVREVCRAAAAGAVWLTRSVHLAMNHVEVTVDALTSVTARAGVDPTPVYEARRSPGEAAGGPETALAAVEPGRLERALEPISDAMASLEEGAAEGRIRVCLRVTCATAALVALAVGEIAVLGALAASAGAALVARCRGGVSPRVDGLSRRIAAALPWIRARRAIPRAALIRPLW